MTMMYSVARESFFHFLQKYQQLLQQPGPGKNDNDSGNYPINTDNLFENGNDENDAVNNAIAMHW